MSLHREMLGRVQQHWLIISTLLVSWLLMQAVHELGHIVAGWLTGGQITQVVLPPLTISRTDVDPNPNPLSLSGRGFLSVSWCHSSGLRWPLLQNFP